MKDFSHISIIPVEIQDNYITGILSNKLASKDITVKSDYEHNSYAADYINISNISNISSHKNERIIYRSDKKLCKMYDDIIKLNKPILSDILPRKRVIYVIKNHIYDFYGKINIHYLIKYLGIEQYSAIELTNTLVSYAIKHINLMDILKPYKDKVLSYYDKICNSHIKWWITIDPGRQYTASLNPRMEYPIEWYGNLSDIFSDRELIDESKTKELSKIKKCFICFEELKTDQNNITLPCGHSFHLDYIRDKCGGLYYNMRIRNSIPKCIECGCRIVDFTSLRGIYKSTIMIYEESPSWIKLGE